MEDFIGYLSVTNSTRSVGSGDDWVDYMLSGILAGHGCSIRDIELSPSYDRMVVIVRFYENEGCSRKRIGVLYLEPIIECAGERCDLPRRFTDAILRYGYDGESVSSVPKWHTVLRFDTMGASYKELAFSLLGK